MHLTTFLVLATAALPSINAQWPPKTALRANERVRTVVTTDVEQDDLTSLVRYLLYTPDIDTQGIIYTASRYHWVSHCLRIPVVSSADMSPHQSTGR
jgi:hypothetical protein